MAVVKHKNNTNKVRQNPTEKEQSIDSKATRIKVKKQFRTLFNKECFYVVVIHMITMMLVSKGFKEKE